MTLRFWDFGGQQVYRATHQFYFSQDALYLVVWNARAGAETNDVAGWISRINFRLAGAARVLLVATHCDQLEPQLDYTLLQREFPGLLCGHYEVDNKSGTGITELRLAIVQQAAAQHLGQVLAENWITARDQILARAATEPQISYQDFVVMCAEHDMAERDAAALAELLHRLGQIVYRSDDEAL